MENLSIKDIARIADVGVSTVSRVLNNHPDVRDDTRERVLKIIEEYNYIPNNSARNLKRASTNNIGVLVKGIHNPFFSRMIKAVEEKINDKGYTMVLHYNDYNSNDVEAAIELIKEKRLRGLVCLGGDFDDLRDGQLQKMETSMVLTSINLTSDLNRDVFSSVTIENEKAAYEAVDYLCKLGHTNIGIIATGEGDKNVGQLRLKGYKRALDESGLPYDSKNIAFGHYTFRTGFEAMDELLNKNPSLTAVFVTSDIMAVGAAKSILSKDLRIPEDISIVGFDGIEYSEFYHPSITTVKQPVVQMGHKSIEILFNLIEGRRENQHMVFETKLLERESCKKIY